MSDSKLVDEHVFSEAVERLRQVHLDLLAGKFDLRVEPSIEKKDEVLSRFQPIFAADHLPVLTEDEFRSFLIFRNNLHWSGLQRLGPGICADMERLRQGLHRLLDESQPIADRYDYAIAHVHKMGRAVATAILHVVYPDLYSVWNSTSEAGLKTVDLWPHFDHGEKEGSRYVKINSILTRLAREISVDLWTLDALWYYLEKSLGVSTTSDFIEEEISTPVIEVEPNPIFGLERHLHEFLRDNWEHTELGKEWRLHQEPGNEYAGYEYPCKVGRIDLLAHHRHEPIWLIVELKRNQTGDQTLGQVMRYMGWVKHHLAQPEEEVRGLIIAHASDDALAYAVSVAPAVDLYHYRVQFHLNPAPKPTSP